MSKKYPSKALTDSAVSIQDIEQLRVEAIEAGDTKTVDLCDRALVSDSARDKCERIILDARAQSDEV